MKCLLLLLIVQVVIDPVLLVHERRQWEASANVSSIRAKAIHHYFHDSQCLNNIHAVKSYRCRNYVELGEGLE